MQPADELSGGRPAKTPSAPGSEHHFIKFDWLRGTDGAGGAEATESVVPHEEAAGVKTDRAEGLGRGSVLVGRVNTQ